MQDAKTALRLYMLKSKAWEKQMRSAMQHRSVENDEEEDTGEQVERPPLWLHWRRGQA